MSNWYIVKQDNEICQIIELTAEESPQSQNWGPFSTQEEAIARRIGLIRAGKCKPQ